MREVPGRAGPHPVLRLEPWETRHPGLVAGVTALERPVGAGTREVGPDFSLVQARGATRPGTLHVELARALDVPGIAAVRQVHGTKLLHAVGGGEGDGLEEADGLLCRVPGLLLLVHVADCVPVYILDPETGALALLHAGWRGVAGGILRNALRQLATLARASADRVYLHLGPAICGRCYEVGSDVLSALGRRGRRASVDLRDELTRQAIASGADRGRITVSTLCTRCGPEPLFSYRRDGTAAGRNAAFLGWRTA